MKNRTAFSAFIISAVFGGATAQTPRTPASPPPPGAVQQPATAQRTQNPQSDDVLPGTVTRRVNLPISVIDKKGKPIAGLTQADFVVSEDKQPQSILSFAVESNNLPLYVGVLMDTSGSTKGKLDFEKEASLNFVHTVARIRRDQIAFATFDDDVVLRQDFTQKLDLLDTAINKIKDTGEHTSLYDAIWRFCDEKMRGTQGLRALVLVTDGDDTYSRATIDEAIEIAQNTETVIFAISTKAGFSGTVAGVEAGQVKDTGDKRLERICQETGGQAFFTGDRLALERAFRLVRERLHSQYIVSYRPSNENYDGSFRRIDVKLARDRDGMRVRTRRGYRATRRADAQ